MELDSTIYIAVLTEELRKMHGENLMLKAMIAQLQKEEPDDDKGQHGTAGG